MILRYGSSVSSQTEPNIDAIIKKQTIKSLELCKYLHQNPELSFAEFETAKLMAIQLEKAGFEVTRKVGGNNVVGIFNNGEGPVLMLRTDMDALPIQENTGLSFASTMVYVNDDGVEMPAMHACGHDIHMSVWAGTIHSLVALKTEWKGTLLVVAQQAEELSAGADAAIDAGLFTKFAVPNYALAFHINPQLEAGTIGLVAGPIFAGVKTAKITVFGKGGHGAYPEKCIDPIVIASRIVLDLQVIASRETSPLEPIVVTVGSIHGGTRPNIIPDKVSMELTLRYYSDEAIKKVIQSIRRKCNSAAIAAGMPEDKLPVVQIEEVETPPVLNNLELSRSIRVFASQAIGANNILKTAPAMVGEDFGKFGRTPENVPVCLIWLGSTNSELMKTLISEGKSPSPLHSAKLEPDYEHTIETGIKVMVGNTIGLLGDKK